MKHITVLLFAAITFFPSSLFAQGKAGKADTTKQTSFYTCSHHPEIQATKAGVCSKCGMKLVLQSKTYQCPMHPEVKSDKPGTCPKCGMNLKLATKEKMKTEVAVYSCSMHADVKSDKPGKCSKCGMNLTKSPTKKQ